MQHSALVVIDLQNDITKNYKEIIEKVNTAIDWAVKKNLWVIYIQHNNLSAGTRTFKPGTRGAELVPEMNVVSEHIFAKTKSNALTSEAFTAFLQEHGITDFILPALTQQPASSLPAITWPKKVIPFMSCRTASPATIKRNCPKCLHIMKARAALLWNFMRLRSADRINSRYITCFF